MSSSLDWSRFTVRINIHGADTKKLYRAWATREGIEYWFLRLGEFRSPDGQEKDRDALVQVNDTYKWLWHGYSDDAVEHGRILECNGTDRLRFSFGKAGDCTVQIKEEARETIVELIQENIPVDDASRQLFHVGCKTGWTFYLANLKSLMEGGIDLRNRNVKLQDMLNS
jgi:uncharacterized protein YndB with AHSA1/START domain